MTTMRYTILLSICHTVPQARHFINRGFQPPERSHHQNQVPQGRHLIKCRPCGTCRKPRLIRGLKPPVNKIPCLRHCIIKPRATQYGVRRLAAAFGLRRMTAHFMNDP